MNLIERAQQFVKEDNLSGFIDLLSDCVAAGNPEGMLAVQLLARDMYSGFTYNWELKAPAAYCLLAWREVGLEALIENALKEPKSKNFSLAFQVLSSMAVGHEPQSIASSVPDLYLRKAVSNAVGDWDRLALAASSNLRALLLSIEDDDDAIFHTTTSLSNLAVQGNGAARSLLHTLTMRSVAVGPRVLAAYDALLTEKDNDESIFQGFFESHPLLLDPRAFQVWAKPNLHGKLEPDFILRTFDDNYVVVEIETPAKLLVTKRGNLSADATHAIDQVLEYQDHLGNQIADSAVAFPKFTTSTGLVVIGRESSLDSKQRDVLRRVNQSRPNLRIVGFDSLSDASKVVTNNVINGIPETILGARLP